MIKLTESQKRELAVAAQCDPRTLVKVLNGSRSPSMASARARAALRNAGFPVPDLNVERLP